MTRFVKQKNGFTLIELIVVLMILAILVAIAYPSYQGYREKAHTAADLTDVKTLNIATTFYETDHPAPNPFTIRTNSSDALMQVLLDGSYLDEKLEPRQKHVSFQWDFDEKTWVLAANDILTKDQIILGGDRGNQWKSFIVGSNVGSLKTITIPKTIEDITITQIYQDAFKGKHLTAVTFAEDSGITRIHARAFKDNRLTEITFPDSLERLDYGAFLDNDIKKITIGSGVYFEGNVFNNSNKFKEIYESQGAGTYLLVEGNWIKQ